MIKMIIRMDEDKINKSGEGSVERIYSAMDRIFFGKGMSRDDTANGIEYLGDERPTDYANFGIIVNGLRKQSWFVENADTWKLCSNDDTDNPNSFSEEDLLVHYGLR